METSSESNSVEQIYCDKEKMGVVGRDMPDCENCARREDVTISEEPQAPMEVDVGFKMVCVENTSPVEDRRSLASRVLGDPEPEVGMVFRSEEQAYDFYHAYARRKGFSVRKNHLGRRKDGTIRTRQFVCNKEGIRSDDRRRMPKKPRAPERTNCMARIDFRVGRDEVWIVSRVILEHNHPLATPDKMDLVRSTRKLLPIDCGLTGQMDSAGIKLNQGSNNMREEVVGAENAGFFQEDDDSHLHTKRMRSLQKGDTQVLLDYLKNMQSKDPSFFYAIQVDDEERITNFFWADARSVIDYTYFGDVVSIDTTYRANKYDMPFAPLIGVNHHKQVVMFGAALLLDETEESFVWLFKTWMVAMSGRPPKTIFTDQCTAMSRAISLVLPNTCHRLCLWHIFQNAGRHLSHVYNNNPNFQKEFQSCIYECGFEEDFQLRWNNLILTHDLIGNSWLEDLYKVREQWALVYLGDTFCAGMTTACWGESIKNVFKKWLNRKLPLSKFIIQYEEALIRFRERELLEDFKSRQTKPALWADLTILKQAAESYTRKMFEEFEEEFKCHLGCLIETSAIDGTMYTFKVSHPSQSRGLVQFDSAVDTIKCSCKKFESTGILCMHALKVLNYMNVLHLPLQYILKRWTKDGKDVGLLNGCGAVVNHDGEDPSTSQYSRVCKKAISIAVKSAVCREALEMTERSLDMIMQEVEAFLHNVVVDKRREDANVDKNYAEGLLEVPKNLMKRKLSEQKKDAENSKMMEGFGKLNHWQRVDNSSL